MTKDKCSGSSSSKNKDSGSKSFNSSSKLDIEAEVARRVAKSEKERAQRAKQLAADIQRRAIVTAVTANQDGGP